MRFLVDTKSTESYGFYSVSTPTARDPAPFPELAKSLFYPGIIFKLIMYAFSPSL